MVAARSLCAHHGESCELMRPLRLDANTSLAVYYTVKLLCVDKSYAYSYRVIRNLSNDYLLS